MQSDSSLYRLLHVTSQFLLGVAKSLSASDFLFNFTFGSDHFVEQESKLRVEVKDTFDHSVVQINFELLVEVEHTYDHFVVQSNFDLQVEGRHAFDRLILQIFDPPIES